MDFRMLLMVGAVMLSTPVAAQDATDDTPEAPADGEMLLDVAAGEGIYEETCRNCHGPKAQGMASFPKLAGQDAAYLSERLHQYKAGEKVGNNSALMYPIASDLSEQDIGNVAAYIAETFD